MDTRAPQTNLLKSKAFLIATAFDWACLGLGIWLYVKWDQPLLLVLAILIGTAPLCVVLLRFSTALKTAKSEGEGKTS